MASISSKLTVAVTKWLAATAKKKIFARPRNGRLQEARKRSPDWAL